MFRGERLDYPDGSGKAILDFSVNDRNFLPDSNCTTYLLDE
jgi:hypothetical protein